LLDPGTVVLCPSSVENPARNASANFRFHELIEDFGELLSKLGDPVQSRKFEAF
jgi:hypothetical protein